MKRVLRFHAAVLIVLATMSPVGCAATGDTTGGEPRFDASVPPSSSNFDAGPLLSTGHTWAELYADYFGNLNRAGCAGSGVCHGDETQPGAQNSQFVCATNDKDSCYTSITSATAALVIAGNATNSALTTQVLRHADGSVGNMPKAPQYGFTAIDLQRINDWITVGALNDSPEDSGTTAIVDAGDAAD